MRVNTRHITSTRGAPFATCSFSIIGGSRYKYHCVCRDKHVYVCRDKGFALSVSSAGAATSIIVFVATSTCVFVATKVLLFQYHWREPLQVSLCLSRQARVCLSRQRFCRDKHTFVATRDVLKLYLLQQIFVATKKKKNVRNTVTQCPKSFSLNLRQRTECPTHYKSPAPPLCSHCCWAPGFPQGFGDQYNALY